MIVTARRPRPEKGLGEAKRNRARSRAKRETPKFPYNPSVAPRDQTSYSATAGVILAEANLSIISALCD